MKPGWERRLSEALRNSYREAQQLWPLELTEAQKGVNRARQQAVEYPDHCPEFWAAVLPELDTEWNPTVRVGNV